MKEKKKKIPASKIKAALDTITAECELLRPHAKRREAVRKNVAFAVNRGKFLTKQEFLHLFNSVQETLASSFAQHKVCILIIASI